MYNLLYTLAGSFFVSSILVYVYFSWHLSKDVSTGLIPVTQEEEK
ncbi:MAG: hypothetical protein ACOVS5_06215 [Oligoflexus sp.]